jgi:hypothetical protein
MSSITEDAERMNSLSIEYQAEQASCFNPWARKRLKTSDAAVVENSADADLAKDMNALSFQEREQVFDDIHGVAKLPEETPDFVKDRIRAFDESMDAIPEHKRKAFQRALFLWPNLRTDIKFKLMFLRADQFDAPKAAQRMVQYYGQKRMLFGEELLVKRITMDDLSEEDIEVFKSGFMVELPLKDQSGRSVFFYDIVKVDWTRVSVDNIVSEDGGDSITLPIC